MGVYFSTSTSKAKAPVGAPLCEGLGSGYVADMSASRCWAVHAMAIPINGSFASMMAAMEAANMWFVVNGSQPTYPTQLNLNGAFKGRG